MRPLKLELSGIRDVLWTLIKFPNLLSKGTRNKIYEERPEGELALKVETIVIVVEFRKTSGRENDSGSRRFTRLKNLPNIQHLQWIIYLSSVDLLVNVCMHISEDAVIKISIRMQ